MLRENFFVDGFKISIEIPIKVVSGGQLDIDVNIEGPDQKMIYKELRKEYDTFMFNTTVSEVKLNIFFKRLHPIHYLTRNNIR